MQHYKSDIKNQMNYFYYKQWIFNKTYNQADSMNDQEYDEVDIIPYQENRRDFHGTGFFQTFNFLIRKFNINPCNNFKLIYF